MKKTKLKIVSVLLFSTILLAGCTNSGKKTSDASDEKVFRLVVQQEMPSADLSLATDNISFTALNNVYEGLYRLDENSKPQPAGAAEKATVSDDGLTYTISLRKDAKWSNGDPVVAADYVYGWQRTINPKTASEYAFLYECIENGAQIIEGEKKVDELGIVALEDHQLEIKLAKPTPYFDYFLAFPSFFPQHKKSVEEYGKEYAKNSEKAVYNGPFVLADFDGPGTDTTWSYLKNDQYWDQETVKLDKIAVDVVKEAPTALNLFENDQADDVILNGELAKQKAGDPELQAVKEARTAYIEFNQREANSPYRNENLRKAISYAIDRKALVEQILGDGSLVAQGLVPEGLAFSPKDNTDFVKETPSVLSYDVKKAQEHWEKAKKELNITELKMDFVADDTDSTKKIVEYIQGALNETLEGMQVSVTPVPFSVRLERGTSGQFDALMGGWGADYADPSSFLDLFVTGNSYNRGHYSNKAYDQLVKDANVTHAGDEEKRWEDMLQTEQLIMSEMGLVPVYQRVEAHLRRDTIKGIVDHGAGARHDYKWTYISE